MEILSARNPRYNDAGGIDLEVSLKGVAGYIPFTASADDSEAHGRELYARATAGAFGDIQPYVAPAPPVVSLVDAKAAKLVSIRNGAESFLQSLALEYGAMEKLTWDQQAAEADALVADPSAPAPLVRSIAAARGMSVLELASRIRANRAQWVVLSGYIVGQRLAYQDQLDAATTNEQVAAIVPVYALP